MENVSADMAKKRKVIFQNEIDKEDSKKSDFNEKWNNLNKIVLDEVKQDTQTEPSSPSFSKGWTKQLFEENHSNLLRKTSSSSQPNVSFDSYNHKSQDSILQSDFDFFSSKLFEKYNAYNSTQCCHFCGIKRTKDARVYCKNMHCKMPRGNLRRYYCLNCLDLQKNYFGEKIFRNIFGNPSSHDWHCLSCIHLVCTPATGICCCDWSYFNMNCVLHDNEKLHCHAFKGRTKNKQLEKHDNLKKKIVFHNESIRTFSEILNEKHDT